MINERLDHTPRWRRATFTGTLQPPVGNGRRIGKERTMRHYYAVAAPDGEGGFWISFPGRPGIASAATSAGEIVMQAQNALTSVQPDLPPSIEGGANPPLNLDGYGDPLVVVIPFEPVSAAKVA